jgi:hypothetical protein
MKQEVKVTFYLKRNEEKEDGTCPVMARLTVRNTEAVFSAKMAVPADRWAAGRVAGKSKTANEINRKLDEIRASALSHWRELSAVRENVTAGEVKNLILGMSSGQETLLAYFRAHNEKFDKRVGVNRSEGSAKMYWNALNHVSKFLSEKYHLSDISFSALDKSFIDKYTFKSCIFNCASLVLDRLHLGNVQVNLQLRSVCTIFATVTLTRKVMDKITLNYEPDDTFAKKMIEALLASGAFSVARGGRKSELRKSIDEAREGKYFTAANAREAIAECLK